MHLDVQVCVPCILAGVGGGCWVFSIILCLIALRQGLLLKKKHYSYWAGQLESSQDQSSLLAPDAGVVDMYSHVWLFTWI